MSDPMAKISSKINSNRQSDAQIVMLQQKLERHIDEYNNHRVVEAERWSRLMSMQESNAKSIKDLTSSTRDLISAWGSANDFGKFMKWLGSFTIVGAAVVWFIDKWA